MVDLTPVGLSAPLFNSEVRFHDRHASWLARSSDSGYPGLQSFAADTSAMSWQL